MGDTQTTKAAETTRVKQKSEDRLPHEREYAPSAFAEATLFRAAASDDPTIPPQHMARVLRRLTTPHQKTGFLRQCQRHYGNAYVQRMVSSRDNGHSSPLEPEASTQEEPIAPQLTALQSQMVPDGVATAYAEEASSLDGPEDIAVQTRPLAVLITPKVQQQKGKNDEEHKPLQSKSVGLLADVQQTGRSTTLTQDWPAVQCQEEKNPGKKIVSAPASPPLRTGGPSAAPGAVIQRGVLDDFGEAVSDVASSAADKVSDVASDAVDVVSDAASDALDAVSGLIDSAVGELRSAFDAIVGQISRVWDTVKNGVTNAVEGAIEKASGFLGGIGAFFGAIGTALSSLDVDSLRTAWAAITGAANAALAGVQGIVAQVTAAVDGLWSGLKGLADGLIGGLRNQAEGLIGRLPGPAQGPARSLWKTIEETLTSTWRTIESSWSSLRESALKRVNEVVAKVAEVVASIKDSVISTIIDTLDKVKGFFTFIKQVIANPDVLIDPIVQEITGRLQGLPHKAKADSQTKAQEQAASGPGATGAAPVAAQAAPAVAIQRVIQRDAAPAGQPRSTLGVGQVISGCWDFITDKLAKLWANLGTTVKEMVIGVLDPRAIWKGLKEDWGHMTKELSTRASRFESIRTDSWASFSEDMSRWFSNLIDFPLIIWRTVNAMLGRLSVYIGLAIILGGAVAGAIAGGTGGAVFGSVFPGAGTAGGGLAGIAAGAWAGAQAGYALAETVGLVLLLSFVAAEQISITKALNDLLWTPQSEEEQNEDFNQTTDSIIAIATALLLMLIAFIGVALAKRVWAFVKSIPGRFKPKPKVVEPEPAQPKPAEPVSANPNKLVICRVCEVVPGVPEDLMARRAKLTPEARARLDQTAKAIFTDPAKPTATQFDNLRKFMDAMEKKGGSDGLEGGLQKLIEGDKKGPPPPPPAKPPFGPEVGQLPGLRSEVEALITEIENFAKANPDKATITEAAKNLRSSTDGTLTKMETGQVEATPYWVEQVQGSIKGAQGELESARTAPSNTKFGEIVDGREIDQVRPDGTYYQVKKWDVFTKADKQFGKVEAQLRGTLEVAVNNPVGGKPRPVVMEFQNGVKKEVADALRAIDVNGHKATIIGKEVP